MDTRGTLTGVFRRTQAGHGFVRPHALDGVFKPEVFIRADKALDAATGDEVLVRVTREATTIKDAAGEIVRVLERATRTFVGTYFERDREAFVRVDGTVFATASRWAIPARRARSRTTRSSSRCCASHRRTSAARG